MTTHLHPSPTSIPLGNWTHLYKIRVYDDNLSLCFLFIAILIYWFKFLFNTNFEIFWFFFNFYFFQSLQDDYKIVILNVQ